MGDLDVTDKVSFGNNDDESLPLTKCVCGQKFDEWEFIISIYPKDEAYACPNCKRRLYFRNTIRVFQAVDNGE